MVARRWCRRWINVETVLVVWLFFHVEAFAIPSHIRNGQTWSQRCFANCIAVDIHDQNVALVKKDASMVKQTKEEALQKVIQMFSKLRKESQVCSRFKKALFLVNFAREIKCPKWSRMDQNGPKWIRMVQN